LGDQQAKAGLKTIQPTLMMEKEQVSETLIFK
jgi:hypothetical protein